MNWTVVVEAFTAKSVNLEDLSQGVIKENIGVSRAVKHSCGFTLLASIFWMGMLVQYCLYTFLQQCKELCVRGDDGSRTVTLLVNRLKPETLLMEVLFSFSGVIKPLTANRPNLHLFVSQRCCFSISQSNMWSMKLTWWNGENEWYAFSPFTWTVPSVKWFVCSCLTDREEWKESKESYRQGS